MQEECDAKLEAMFIWCGLSFGC